MNREINIGIIGVGNCASSLLQGLEYYKLQENVSKLLRPTIVSYSVENIKIVSVFDIDERKIYKPLHNAIFTEPNCAIKFYEVDKSDVIVSKGVLRDNIPPYKLYDRANLFPSIREENICNDTLIKSELTRISGILKKSNTKILINFLPTGYNESSYFYANCAIMSNVAFINCTPTSIARDEAFSMEFEQRNLPLIGDDIKSQIGATILHRTILELFEKRGIEIINTYQVNMGGNTDFANMSTGIQSLSKKRSKSNSLNAVVSIKLDDSNSYVGVNDYIPWLKDNKICYIRIEGKQFGGVPVSLDIKLNVQDSPNCAAILIDVIRLCRIALDKNIGGAINSISAFAMKNPPKDLSDSEALNQLSRFIKSK